MDKYHEQALQHAQNAKDFYDRANEVLADEIERIKERLTEFEEDVKIIESNVDILANASNDK